MAGVIAQEENPPAPPHSNKPTDPNPIPGRPASDGVHSLGNPYLRLEIEEPSDRIRIDDDIHLLVAAINLGDEPLNIAKLWVHPPHELIATRAGGTTEVVGTDSGTPVIPPMVAIKYTHPEWFTTQRNSQMITIPAKSTGIIRITIPAPKLRGYEIFKSVRVLFFHPSEYTIRVQADHELPENHETSSASVRVKIKLVPSPWSYVYGGILGSLLAIVFRKCFDATITYCSCKPTVQKSGSGKPVKPTTTSLPPLALSKWQAVWNLMQRFLAATGCVFAHFLTGCFVALLLLLINYRLKDTSMSVNIAVTDFLGAVVLGIFSHKLARKVYDLVFNATVQLRPASNERL